jgi:ADP-ribosylation factor GTPase-activating protein 2/3
MQVGGNANAHAFFSQHHCSTSDAQQKYHSRAAQLYKEKLAQNVSKLNKLHGNQIVFEEKGTEVVSSAEKESDFFDEIHKTVGKGVENLAIDNQARLFEAKNTASNVNQPGEGPSVDGIFSPSSTTAGASSTAPRKTTIGQRKPGTKVLHYCQRLRTAKGSDPSVSII